MSDMIPLPGEVGALSHSHTRNCSTPGTRSTALGKIISGTLYIVAELMGTFGRRLVALMLEMRFNR